jgi:hypothetical protein
MRKALSLLYAVLFVVGASHGQTVVQAKQDVNPAISQFVLYAERSIKLSERSHVDGGDVGVRTSAAPKEKEAQLFVGDHAKGRNMFAPSITLGHDAEVHEVWTYSLKSDPDTKLGTKNGFPAAAMPPLPLVTASGKGLDVTVKQGKRLSLTPGTYGQVTLELHSRLELASGRYTFTSIRMEEGSDWVAEHGPVDARIVQGLWMARHATIAPHMVDAKARDFTIEVAGSDPTTVRKDSRLAPTTAVSIAQEAKVHALLSAPHGTVWMAEDIELKGAVAAFDIVVGARSRAEFESGFAVGAENQHGSQQLHGYYGIDADANSGALVGPVAPDTNISLAVGLPIRDPQGLKTLIKQVSDPKSSSFRKYLTPAQFYATYGATASDYQTLQDWAETSNGFTIDTTYPNHLLLSVTGTAAQIEKALYVNLVYRRRKDGTNFVAVDRDPSLDLTVPILHISGLNELALPTHSQTFNGTGYARSYRAADLRNAYLGVGSPCQKLDGTGQVVGIVESDSFNSADIMAYDGLQIPPINPSNVSLATTEGGNPPPAGAIETAVDIEMVQAMAPNAQVRVFQGNSGITGHLDDILHAMATSSPALNVVSCSLVFGRCDNAQQAIDEMAAQGVSFFTASGDFGDVGDPHNNLDMDNQTLVGGTFLSTNGLSALPPIYPSNYYAGETTWNQGGAAQSAGVTGGGIMDGNNKAGGNILNPDKGCQCWPQPVCCGGGVPIPDFQVGVSMANNGGSTIWRNYPDVSMAAAVMEIVFNDKTRVDQSGTSFAAPLWAGFTALVNQQSQQNGGGPMGFLNPTLYDIGLTGGSVNDLYSVCFHDISDGRTNANGFGNGFTTVPGYDLTTGWGTPSCPLINQLSSPTPLTPNQPLSLIEFVIATGDDNLRPNGGFLSGCNGTGATADVFLQNGTTFTVTLKTKGTSEGWANASVQTLDFPIPPSVSPPLTQSNGISGVRINIQEDWVVPCTPDNWDLASLAVSLFNPGSPKVIQLSLNGTSTLQDGSTGLNRFSSSAGSSGSGPSACFMVTSGTICP